jgi:hypothetical protein
MTKTIHTYWDYIEPYWDVFDIYNGLKGFETSIRGVPRPAVLLYAAHFCHSEVHNGGFLQFFWNNTGVLAPEAIEGYSVIGMPTSASLLKEAASRLGTPYPRDREDRWEALLAASERGKPELMRIFEKLDPDDTRGFYKVFVESTRNLRLDELDKQFFQAAKTENGGFEDAATRFANAPRLLQ